MSKFQIGLLVFFGFFIVAGVAFFAFFQGGGTPVSRVTIWGTIPRSSFATISETLPIGEDDTYEITYIEKNRETFDEEFLESLALGTGPDLVLISQDDVLKHLNKFFLIPYQSVSERDYRSTFVEEAEMFLLPDGIVAMPIVVDPLVMYWNRDLFTNAGIANPPIYWDEFFNLTRSLTVKDGALNLDKSTVALGEYSNIDNAKEIMSALVFQAGNPIVEWQGTRFASTFNDRRDQPVLPASSALTFYTEFSNPTKAFYSWNRSLPEAQSVFVAGDLATYFGFASELLSIRLKNPNLNFDVSMLPQSRNSGRNITFGNLMGLAIVKNSKNIGGAFGAAMSLSGKASVESFSENLRLPPARRDLLSSAPSDPYMSVFYNGALWARGWFDPDPQATEALFQEMIESVTAGRLSLERAINELHNRLNDLLQSR